MKSRKNTIKRCGGGNNGTQIKMGQPVTYFLYEPTLMEEAEEAEEKEARLTVSSRGGALLNADEVDNRSIRHKAVPIIDVPIFDQVFGEGKSFFINAGYGENMKDKSDIIIFAQKGGSKLKSRTSRKSRKSKKTKKGRGAYEGGKKKCPKHCRRKTRRTRKGLKHRKY
mgnify:FL=1